MRLRFLCHGCGKLPALALALYAVCVFPADIKQAINRLGAENVLLSQWLYHLIRLPLPPLLVWMALFVAKVLNWLFRRAKT